MGDEIIKENENTVDEGEIKDKRLKNIEIIYQ